MSPSLRDLAREIRDLANKLGADGWDRLRGLRLVQVAAQVPTVCGSPEWIEAIGRAGSLIEALGEFVHQAPQGDRLAQMLRVAIGLANLLEAGRPGNTVDRDSLPADPGAWRFVLVGDGSDADLADDLYFLGFAVAEATTVEAVMAFWKSRTVLLVSADWLYRHAAALAAETAGRGDAPVLVALADSSEFLVQVQARQAGAHLLLDMPLDLARLMAELAGVAWMPRIPYRVLLVDDDAGVLALHAHILQEAGCEVLAAEDPVLARDFLDEFNPEACVLDVEMPSCRGTDLAALLRRNKRFARLPVIYLSAFSDIEHQLDARLAGGEDYLSKPVDGRLLVTAVLARARQFRLFETTYRQRHQAWRHLDNLRASIDAHALVSVADLDGTIVDANHKFCEVSGYSREELIGHNHRIIRSGHHPTCFFEEMWATISGGRIWQGEVKNRRKDGRHYWVQNTIVPILDEAGLPTRYIAIRTDVTESKRILAERERQSRLLDLLRQALLEFMASQDVKTTSSLLLEGVLQLTDSAYGFLGEVQHGSEGQPALKYHALTGIAGNADTRALYEQARTTGMAFHTLDTLFGTVLRAGETVIVNDPAQDLRGGPMPPGHPHLETFIGIPLRQGDQIIGMLGLANRPGGYDAGIEEFLRIYTTTCSAILEAARLQQYRQQAIADLQQARDKAEHTYRSRDEYLTTWGRELRSSLNTLVGNAQILMMSEGIEGDVRESTREIVRNGQQLARLLAELMARVQTETPALPQSGPVLAAGERQRILVAEDNLANQAVLRMQLDVLGYIADLAGDGGSAMAKWQAGGHVLILADRHMPGMDGLELARAIRARERNSGTHIPIIAITALQNREDLAACRQAGMDDTLPKPIELDDLRRMLERWLSRDEAAPARVRVEQERREPLQEAGATLDLGHLSRIIGSADVRQARELVDLFTVTARGDFPTCRRHLGEGHGRGLALVMHKLKSSARMVGALRFAGLAESIELAARNERMELAATQFGELEHALDDVEAAVSQIGLSTPSVLPVPGAGAGHGPLPRHVLIVDDDPVARRQLGILLAGIGVGESLAVEDATEALAELARRDAIDLLISDLNMPGMDGIEFLRRLAEKGYRGDLILSSGVEERLLQTAAEFALARGMNLRGTLHKPVTRDALLGMLTHPRTPVVTSPALPSEMVTTEDILEGLRRDEFEVHFQPKVDAATLRAVGVEALARWRHQGREIPPDVFIVAAERHGLIAQLSEALITKALIGGARMEEAGYPLVVAVNVSANWLADVRLPEFILASIQATHFRAENLILEITETGLMADMATALDVMSRLRLKGFKLSIDDFGTGYSSLEQLQRFPFSELKLDRAFVRGAAEKPAALAILASTLEMAGKLQLSTVAEGVETQADLDLVRGLGCNLVQGWLVARAMPLAALLEWLKQRNDS